MKNFKKKSLYLAMAASLGASCVASAQQAQLSGMFVNSDGTGQVLIYPYYTTRGGMDTYLSLVNTTPAAKAVKVRFIESLNSREVLDFNLYLSPYDMWTGAIVDNGTGAKLITADKSCTAPLIPSEGKSFVNYAYTGTIHEEDEIDHGNSRAHGINIGGADGESSSLDRTREGYFEIIEMGEIPEFSSNNLNTAQEFTNNVLHGITHLNGVPKDCSVVQNLRDTQVGVSALFLIERPGGGLTGSASLIAPASGVDYSYDPVAIDNFANDTTHIWHESGTIEPDLRHGRSQSLVFYDHAAVYTDWSGTGEYSTSDSTKDSVDAVNALLMHTSVINEFVLDNITLSGTDWVVTMPTKRYSVPIKNPDKAADEGNKALPPFTSTFWQNGACEPVEIEYYDREENSHYVGGFSPPPPGVNNALCWEANVITFNDSNVLNSKHSVNINVDEGFQNGWMRVHFEDSDQYQASIIGGHTYYGLPVIGFMVQDFVNLNAAPGVMATYGGNFKHKSETCIQAVGQGLAFEVSCERLQP